ncbi:MAG: hypothetical protein NT010_00990 [Proteobacteria bacterium]|nr:hypothetical protein [Pseudomonadota bacterium]
MKIFQAEMNSPALSCRMNRYDGLCEDKVSPPGGVPLRYIEDSAVPQSTKQDAKYQSAGHRCIQPLTGNTQKLIMSQPVERVTD